jgi:hypothetical protein
MNSEGGDKDGAASVVHRCLDVNSVRHARTIADNARREVPRERSYRGMPNLRLLMRRATLALTPLWAACVSVHIGPVSGRVVDAQSGEGIGGVEIFRTYDTRPIQMMGEVSGHRFTSDWTTSDKGGEFNFPSKWLVEWPIDGPPSFTWVHRDYGWEQDVWPPSDGGRLEIRVKRSLDKVRAMRGTTRPVRGLDDACTAVEGGAAYAHCLQVAYAVDVSQ